MPRRGFGKKKGGYKGPLPGPEKGDAEGERSVAAQKPAQRPPLTHFLCLPLVTAESRPQLQASLQKFREDALRQEGTRIDADSGAEQVYRAGSAMDVGEKPAAVSIPQKAIRPVGTLHLTLGVMSLQTPEKVDEAISLLNSLDIAALLGGSQSADSTAAGASKAFHEDQLGAASHADEEATTGRDRSVGPGSIEPLVFSLKSLVSMHPPGKTSILYAEPDDPTGRLYPFCGALRNLFLVKGLMIEDTRPLKLHATLVNTIYAKAGGRHVTRIDATSLIPRYADHIWADGIHVGKVAICKMGAKKMLNDQGIVISEEYEQIASAEV